MAARADAFGRHFLLAHGVLSALVLAEEATSTFAKFASGAAGPEACAVLPDPPALPMVAVAAALLPAVAALLPLCSRLAAGGPISG
jgi:hypothetical protein